MVSHQYELNCKRCGRRTSSHGEHILCMSPSTDSRRRNLWDEVYNALGPTGFQSMMTMTVTKQFEMLISLATECVGEGLRYPAIAVAMSYLAR